MYLRPRVRKQLARRMFWSRNWGWFAFAGLVVLGLIWSHFGWPSINLI